MKHIAPLLFLISALTNPALATTIAFDGRYFACDSQVTVYGHIRERSSPKIIYCPEKKCYIGMAGSVSQFQVFVDWLTGKSPKQPIWKEVDALVVYAESRRCFYYGSARPIERHGPVAIGTGFEFAKALMALGAPAHAGVAVACKLDIFTSPPILEVDTLAPAPSTFSTYEIK